jgi:Kef-type K+ transport system membrane component KefB
MIRLLSFILFFSLLMGLLTQIHLVHADLIMSESMMALGFTLITAYLLGLFTYRFQMPKITGYIIAGIICGPYFINLLSVKIVTNLQLIDNIALSLIALTAGGEFRYKEIRPQIKTISNTILWKIIFIFVGFIFLSIIFAPQINFLKDKSLYTVIGITLILAAISVATSPATVIAVITESKAKGRFTDFVLGVTVFKDIIVVLLFSISLSIAEPLILSESAFHLEYLFNVILELALSILVGIAAGWLIIIYLRFVDKQRILFLLGFVLLGIELSQLFHLEIVLIFMVAGFFVQNFSENGPKLIHAIEGSSLPIYVIFFAIAGANLNIPLFLSNWVIALAIVVLRLITTYGGTYVGGKLTKAPIIINHYGWMGFVGQAGLSLGLSVLVIQAIPGFIGIMIRTLILSTIAINQIIGPILFRFSLFKAGEVHKTS